MVTIHRAENTDDPERLKTIFLALEYISENTDVIFPLHPRTKMKLNLIGYDFSKSKIHFVDPVGYLEMVWLLKECEFVMTDSGGVQKEAYFFKKYCITLRDETEWVELVNKGFNLLVGSDKDRIITAYRALVDGHKLDFNDMLYGEGKAGEKIISYLL